jgi:hypothetical protein
VVVRLRQNQSLIKMNQWHMQDTTQQIPSSRLKYAMYYCKNTGHIDRVCRRKCREDRISAGGTHKHKKGKSLAPCLLYVYLANAQSVTKEV